MDLFGLKRLPGEDIFDYYMRADDTLADAFKSICEITLTADSVEIMFNAAYSSFEKDWAECTHWVLTDGVKMVTRKGDEGMIREL